MAEMMMPLTSRKTSEPVKLVKPVKCGPICVTTEITPNGGLPMIVLPGLVRAVLSRGRYYDCSDGRLADRRNHCHPVSHDVWNRHGSHG